MGKTFEKPATPCQRSVLGTSQGFPHHDSASCRISVQHSPAEGSHQFAQSVEKRRISELAQALQSKRRR